MKADSAVTDSARDDECARAGKYLSYVVKQVNYAEAAQTMVYLVLMLGFAAKIALPSNPWDVVLFVGLLVVLAIGIGVAIRAHNCRIAWRIAADQYLLVRTEQLARRSPRLGERGISDASR